MKKILTFALLISLTLIVISGCAPVAPQGEGIEPEKEEVEAKIDTGGQGQGQELQPAGHGDQIGMARTGGQGHGQELHQAGHGGQVGMASAAAVDGTDFHLEIVSDAPGQYLLYLSDKDREPVDPEGYEGALAVVKPDGSEIASLPFKVMEDHLLAEGGPADVSQADVRITLKGPGLAEELEMDFTILYTR